MSYAQGTTHYNFPQIAGTDRPTFADANEAFRILDTKLFSLESDASDLDTRLDTAENNIVELTSAVGTAQETANTANTKADTNAENITLINTTLSQHATQIGNKLDAVAIADPYDPTSTYAVDDIVTYNGQRWRCTTAVTVGEPFDVSKWIGEDVQTVLSQLNSDLRAKQDKSWTLLGSGSSAATHEWDLPSSFSEMQVTIGYGLDSAWINVPIYPVNVPNSGNNFVMNGYYFDTANNGFARIGLSSTKIGVDNFQLNIGGNTRTAYTVAIRYR